MSNIYLYKTRAAHATADSFMKIARKLGIDGKSIETDEALAVNDKKRALLYGQPCSKYAGLLFFTDQSKSLGEVSEKSLSEKRAKRWADEFLKEFDLIPRKTDDRRIKLSFATSSYQADAVVFDGKERTKAKVKTEVASKISLGDIPVTGPRAKVRMGFKEDEKPVMIHCGLWEEIEVYEEKELVREHDIVKTVKEKLAKRSNCKAVTAIVDVKLAYFAGEFAGGPDLLAPYYFIDVEFEDKDGREQGIEQGPRQLIWLPAYR